ncbi:MAG: sigma-70 family RNA polymerase sigma factor [Pseudomonadota bacterium]
MTRSRTRKESDALDRARLARVAQGDMVAFESLYADYHDRIARFLLRLSDDHALVEEVINDTLYAVWNQADTFRGSARVSTWIMGIAYRKAISSLRSRERRKNRENDVALQAEQRVKSTEIERTAQSEWIELALSRLPIEQRATIELAYLLGYTCREIAEVQSCPVNTVKTRLFHARRRLRDLLPDLADAIPSGVPQRDDDD